MAKLTRDIIRAQLPVLAAKLEAEDRIGGQRSVIDTHLNGTRTPGIYTQLLEALNSSPHRNARRVLNIYYDRDAKLPPREQQLIIRILSE